MNPNQIPQNPIRELDEFYVKDDKVLQADSEQIANDWFKQRDDENFQKELLKKHYVPKWLESRDCDPFTGKVLESRLVDDPSAPGGKRGMRFADFMLHPIVLLCQLTAAEVFALRFYTTAGFKGINWQDFVFEKSST
jgi:hypothetical protein